jgi:hypothetical protein
MSDNLKAQVAKNVTTLENVTVKVDELATAHDENVSRLSQLEARIGELATAAERAASSGMLGPTAKMGSEVVQDIVNFLHYVFPGVSAGKPAPGVPTELLNQDDSAQDGRAKPETGGA